MDYGLAYRYSPEGVPKEYKEDPKRCHDGTIEFTSIDAHKGVCKKLWQSVLLVSLKVHTLGLCESLWPEKIKNIYIYLFIFTPGGSGSTHLSSRLNVNYIEHHIVIEKLLRGVIFLNVDVMVFCIEYYKGGLSFKIASDICILHFSPFKKRRPGNYGLLHDPVALWPSTLGGQTSGLTVCQRLQTQVTVFNLTCGISSFTSFWTKMYSTYFLNYLFYLSYVYIYIYIFKYPSPQV